MPLGRLRRLLNRRVVSEMVFQEELGRRYSMRISWQERPEALYFLRFSLLSILMISLLRQAAIMRMTCRRAISGQFCGIMRLEVWKWQRQENVTFIIEDHLWGQSAKAPILKGAPPTSQL